MGETSDSLTLKWGTLKAWHFSDATYEKIQPLLKEYGEIGISPGAMTQHDTPRQREIICEIIDACNLKTVYLDWDGKEVSKDEAKKYVTEYGSKRAV